MIEGENLFGREFRDAVAVGYEVVDEEEVRDVEAGRQLARVEHPGKIGEPQTAAAHWTGNTEAGRGDFGVGAFGEEAGHDFLKPAVLVGGVALIANVNQLAVLERIQREVNLGAADVTGENHLAISKLPAPFAPGVGRWAAAAESSRNSSRPFCGWMSCEGRVSGS